MARVADLLEAARSAGLAVWAEGDHLVVRGPARAAQLARELHEHASTVLAHLASTELHAIFLGPVGAPAAPCCECGSVVRLYRPEPHPRWLRLDCRCGHRGYMKLADYADWRLRQLRAATAPTRLGRAFTVAVVTAA